MAWRISTSRVMDAVTPCEAVEVTANAGCGAPAVEDGGARVVAGTTEIEIGAARVHVSGVVDPAALRQALSHLRRKP